VPPAAPYLCSRFAGRAILDRMPRRLSSPVFAGRASELDELMVAMARARDGAPGVVLVGGEAGVGKSRLVSEFAARTTEEGAHVLCGRCAGTADGAIPLLPVAEALRGLADGGGDLRDDDVFAPWPPSVGGRAGVRRGAASSMRLGAVVLERLVQASGRAPVLMVLEDVHWADRSTLDVVTFIARRLHGERILLVATYRSDEVDRRHDLRRLLADLATAPVVQRLPLGGLTRAEMDDQLAGLLGAAPRPEVLEAIFGRSDGNPFFAEELIAAAEGPERGLSPTLGDMLLDRLEGLDVAARSVVGIAAAGGREVHHRLLEAAAGLAEPELTEALHEAVRHHVLVARGEHFAFRHALVQEVAYGRLLPGERARLHAGFAAALEARPDVAGGNAATVAAEVAHHWLRAGDRPRALAAAVRAGTAAEGVGALAEAARHLTSALELWDVVEDAECAAGVDRATLLARAANAAAWVGRPADAIRLVADAIALVDPAVEPVRAALLLQGRGRFLYEVGRAPSSVRDFERAVELIAPEPPSIERARALGRLGWILMLTGEHARSRAHCEAAITVARAVGADVEEADALASLGLDLGALGNRPAALECLRRARSIATGVGDDEIHAQTAIALSAELLFDGQLAEAVDVALAGARESRRAGLAIGEGICQINAAEAAYELGRWDLVDRLAGELLARDLTGVTLSGAHHVAGAVARARGDLEGAEAHLMAERAAIGSAPASEDACYALRSRAELALLRGDLDDASRAARQGLDLAAEDHLGALLLASLGVRAEADRAELARARSDADAQADARERARAFHAAARTRVGQAGHAALAATVECEAARAQGTCDPARWDAAARAWENRRTPYQTAYARWRQAELALAHRDRAQAREALIAAHATTTVLGAGPLRSKLEALARRARIELPIARPTPSEERAPSITDDLGLTPRELEVLEHLALGETNRQIADKLFISIKTAGVHVSHILSKLDAANRGEAAAAAHRLGLVP
jgi:DNA-binding CsgD family transcriptional regulator